MLKNKSVSDEVYDILKKEIIQNQLQPGEHLIVSALSAKFGISGIPIREALVRLTAEKFLILEHNKGFRVAAKPCNNDLYQWHEARVLIESYIADAVIAKMTEAELNELKRLNYGIRSHDRSPGYENHSYLITMNADFHTIIVNAAGNRLINDMYTAVNYDPHLVRFHEGQGVADLDILCDEHDEIISAIEEKNPARYIEKTRSHIIHGFKRQIALCKNE
ncbi:GntR family transcriptional regulator [Sodalis sp. dw_96]|uniref:GntR family transcriptional regulator n=1 Tax=Sodalis sp. dw_96 TaxID=2719794 RepID=UPI001BD38259|nr:GntR family transcriptional regulator [Sodalis sp. dw_96]